MTFGYALWAIVLYLVASKLTDHVKNWRPRPRTRASPPSEIVNGMLCAPAAFGWPELGGYLNESWSMIRCAVCRSPIAVAQSAIRKACNEDLSPICSFCAVRHSTTDAQRRDARIQHDRYIRACNLIHRN